MFRPLTVAVALGVLGFAGGAYAGGTGLIGSAQIKDHSIQLVDINRSAINALRGQQGPQGPPGTFDPRRLSRTAGAQSDVAPDQVVTATVSCPSGGVALGGGGGGGLAGIAASVPLTTSAGAPVGWAVIVVNRTTVTVQAQAFVVCAAT